MTNVYAAPAMPDMVTVPTAAWQELLDTTRELSQRVSDLEARLGATGVPAVVETGNPLVPFRPLADVVTGLSRGVDIQLFGADAHEATKLPAERIAEIAAKGELLAAVDQLISPYQGAFEDALSTRAETVRRLPKRPGPDAKQVFRNGNWISAEEDYTANNFKVVSWQEPLPSGTYDKVTYIIRYLPAQTRVKDSKPEMLSFTATTRLADAPTIPGFRHQEQRTTCEIRDGRVVRLTSDDVSRGMDLVLHQENETLTLRHYLMLAPNRLSIYHTLRGRMSFGETTYPEADLEYVYNEAARTLVCPGEEDDELTPRLFLESLASLLRRIPIIES